MIRAQVQFTEQQAKMLKLASSKEGVSTAELVRRAVTEFLSERAAHGEEWRRKQALSVTGLFSADPNLSTNHDDAWGEP